MDKSQLYRLINELEDKSKNKISIEKFRKIYTIIINDTPYADVEDTEAKRKRKLNELLQKIVSQVRTKAPSIEEFFYKYDYDKYLRTVPFPRFEQALGDLGIHCDTFEMNILRAEMDPGRTNTMDISAIFNFKGDVRASTPNLHSLSPTEKTELDNLLEEFKAYTTKNRINLLNELTRADYGNENYLSKDEFLFVLKAQKMSLTEAEARIVSIAFGNPSTGKINYRKFCDAINDARVLDKSEVIQDIPKRIIDPYRLEERLKQLYTAIRQNFATLEDFFIRYDRDGSKSINRNEFVGILRDLRIDVLADEIDALYDKIDTKGFGKIYYVSLAMALKTYIDTDTRRILNGILGTLYDQGKTLEAVLNSFQQYGGYIKLLYLIDAFQGIDPRITKDDVPFLLSNLAVKINPTREVSIDDLFAQLDAAGKRLNVLTDNQLQSVLRRGGNNTRLGDSTFRADDRQNRWGESGSNESYLGRKDVIEQTKWAKSIFLDIRAALARQGQNFPSCFSTYDGKMNIVDCRNRLANLGIRIDHQISQLLNELCDDIQPNMVDIRLFERAYNYHKDAYEAEESRFRAPVDYYKDIRFALNQPGKSFEQCFEKYDLARNGTISAETFKFLLGDELRLNMSPESIQRIIDECSDYGGKISLVKLRKNIFPDTQINYNYNALEEINKLKQLMKSSNMTPHSLFKLFDLNNNEFIDEHEFSLIISKIDPKVSPQVIAAVFSYLDKDFDRKINRNEFFTVFEDENARAERALESLKETVRRGGFNAQRTFDMFDSNRQGYIEIYDFTRIMEYFDRNLSKDDINFLFRKFDTNQNGRITKAEFIKQFTDNSFDQYNENAARSLLRELQTALSRMSSQEVTKLYQLVDRNRSGRVNYDDFDLFCRSIDRRLNSNDTMAIFRLLDTDRSNSLYYNDFIRNFTAETTFDPRRSQDMRGYGESPVPGPYRGDNSGYGPSRGYGDTPISGPYRGDNSSYGPSRGYGDTPIPGPYRGDNTGYGASRGYDSGNYGNPLRNSGYGILGNQPSRELLDSLSWASDIFEELAYIVGSIENTTIDAYFTTYDGTMDKNEVKRRLDALGIPVNFDTDRWLGQISDRNGNVNIQLLKACAEHFKATSRRLPDDFERAHLDMIRAEINDRLNRERLDFDRAFGNLFHYTTQTCSKYDLESAFNRLGIRSNSNVKLLFKKLGDYSGNIRMNDFRSFLGDVRSSGNFGGSINPEAILNQLRRTIESLGLDAETVFDRFDAQKDGTITLEEFEKGIKFFDEKLRKDEVKSLFDMLDKDRKGSINKFRFVKSLSKIPTHKIPDFLTWANPIFEQINKCVEKNKRDLYTMMRVDRGLVTKQSFKQALFLLEFDVDKHEQELQQIIEVLSEDRPDTINFDAFEECLKRAKEAHLHQKIKKDFTQEELESISNKFALINKIMTRDTLTFDQVFVNRDRANRGFITTKDFEDIIINEFFQQMDKGFYLLMQSCQDLNGNLLLSKIKEGLDAHNKQAAPQKTLGDFILRVKQKFNNNTEGILQAFDQNRNGSISQREFLMTCNKIFGIPHEEARVYYDQIEKADPENLTIIEFTDALESDLVEKKRHFKEIRKFVLDYKNELLRRLEMVDEQRQGMLSLNHIQIAFSNCGNRVDISDLEYLVKRLRLDRDYYDRYNYIAMVDAIIKEDEAKKESTEIDELLARLKKQVLMNNIDLAYSLKGLDREGYNKLELNKIYEFLSKYKISLSRDQRELLSNVFQPQNGKVDIQEFVTTIFNGRKKADSGEELIKQAQYIKGLLSEIKTAMYQYRLDTVFKVFKTQDEFIPVKQFVDGIESLGAKNSNDIKYLTDLCLDATDKSVVDIIKFEYILNNFDKYQGGLSIEDSKYLDERFNELRTFMIQDKKTFDSMLRKQNCKTPNGFITRHDFEKILNLELGIEFDERSEKFLRLITNPQGLIDVNYLQKNLAIAGTPNFPNPSIQYDPNKIPDYTQQLPERQQTINADPRIQGLNNSQTISKLPTQGQNISQNVYDPNLGQSGVMKTSRFPDPYQSKPTIKSTPLTSLKYTGDLVADLKTMFRSRGMRNNERFLFFDEKAEGRFSFNTWVEKIKLLGITDIPEKDLTDLFYRIDVNRTNFISENEFRYTFDDNDEESMVSYQNIKLTKELQDEIMDLFRELDMDGNGTLDIHEVVRSLTQLGGNPTQEEISKMFALYDKDKDGKITKEEFYAVMEEKLKKDILQLEDLLSSLREEFKKVDIYNRRELTPDQLRQALINLGIDLKNDEFSALIQEIDTDKSGTIDIDEFIGFITSPPEGKAYSSEVDAAILNIKKANKLSLLDILHSFRNMPSNFIYSFTRDLMRKLENLPSSTLKPRVNSSGVVYVDVKPNIHTGSQAFTRKKKGTDIDAFSIKPIPSSLASEIKLVLATGIPIPSERNVNRATSIIGREVRVCLFNKTTNKFIGNIERIPADWRPEYEGNPLVIVINLCR